MRVAALRRGWLRADIGRTLPKIVRLFLRSDAREVSGSYSSVRVPSGTGPPEGRRPARPLTRKFSFNCTVSIDAIRENHRFSRYRRAFRPKVSFIGRYGPYRCLPGTRRQIRNRGPAPRPGYVQAVRASVPPRPPAIRPEPFRSPPNPCSPPLPTHSPTSTPPASG